MTATRGGRWLLALVPLLFFAAFLIYPLVAILGESLRGEQGFQLAPVLEIFTQPSFWRVVGFTFAQAIASTVLTLAIGMPLAAIFARFDFPGKSILRALTTIPFVMPTVVVAAAFTTILGPQGMLNLWLRDLLHTAGPPINLIHTIWIILLAHAFYNVSVVIRTVGGFWETLNPSLSEAGRVLGAHGVRLFREVTFPLLKSSIIAASLLVFLFCFTSFGVILILGGLKFATIEVEIYRQTVGLMNLRLAAVLCMVQMAITFVIMAVYTRVQARAALPIEARPAGSARRATSWRQKGAILLLLALMVFLLIAPLLALAWRSFTLGGQGFTTQYYTELAVNRRQSAFFAPPISAISTSLAYAIAATALAMVLGVLGSYALAQPRSLATALLDPIFLLPLGVSAVTLGLGYILTMGPLRTSFWLVPLAHALIATPFVVRTFLPALRSVDPRLREAAAVLGANPRRTWREVDLPLLRRALLVSAAFAFTISLGEFGATLLISRPDRPTMPMVIYRLLAQPGLLNFGQALAMSTLLMAVCALALILIERFRLPGEEF